MVPPATTLDVPLLFVNCKLVLQPSAEAKVAVLLATTLSNAPLEICNVLVTGPGHAATLKVTEALMAARLVSAAMGYAKLGVAAK